MNTYNTCKVIERRMQLAMDFPKAAKRAPLDLLLRTGDFSSYHKVWDMLARFHGKRTSGHFVGKRQTIPCRPNHLSPHHISNQSSESTTTLGPPGLLFDISESVLKTSNTLEHELEQENFRLLRWSQEGSNVAGECGKVCMFEMLSKV